MNKFILCVLCACVTSPLFAKSITNQELLRACQDKSSAAKNFCYGFVISAANAAQFYRNIVDIEGQYIDICFPEEISNKEIVDLYISWADTHKTVMQSPAFIGVSTSFSTKYSCKPEKEG